jgi:hypothetical protein
MQADFSAQGRFAVMRFVRVAFVIMASVLAGGVWGYVRGRNATGEGPKMLTQVYALGEYETLTGLQYQQASTDQGKKALLDLLDFMRQLNAGQGNAIGNRLSSKTYPDTTAVDYFYDLASRVYQVPFASTVNVM